MHLNVSQFHRHNFPLHQFLTSHLSFHYWLIMFSPLYNYIYIYILVVNTVNNYLGFLKNPNESEVFSRLHDSEKSWMHLVALRVAVAFCLAVWNVLKLFWRLLGQQLHQIELIIIIAWTCMDVVIAGVHEQHVIQCDSYFTCQVFQQEHCRYASDLGFLKVLQHDCYSFSRCCRGGSVSSDSRAIGPAAGEGNGAPATVNCAWVPFLWPVRWMRYCFQSLRWQWLKL